MSLSNSRRSTDRIRRNKDEAPAENERSSRRPSTGSSQRKAASPEAPAPSSSTKRVASPVNEKSSSLGADSKRTLSPQAVRPSTGTSTKVSPKPEEKPPVSTISKRQQVVPAAEAKKPSTRLPITEAKKTSGRLPIPEPKKVSSKLPPESSSKLDDDNKKTVSKVPIKPLDDAKAVSSSKRMASSLETTIVKPKDVSASTRKKMAEASEEPEAAPKSSTKRARAANNSGRSAPSKSGRSSSRGGAFGNNKNNTIYAIMGGILLVLVVMIAYTVGKGPKPAKKTYKENDVHLGANMCDKAKSIFRQNPDDPSLALKQLEEGLAVLRPALDKMRNANGDLPADYSGWDSRLADYMTNLKLYREQSMIKANNRERNK